MDGFMNLCSDLHTASLPIRCRRPFILPSVAGDLADRRPAALLSATQRQQSYVI